MLYFDTSFLVPLFLPESTTERVQRFLSGRREQPLAISHWTRAEFSSSLAREVRMRKLDPTAAIRADVEFENIVEESFEVLLPMREDFDLCKQYLRRFETGLRTGDALHLAIAVRRGVSGFYTFDQKLTKVGRQFGLAVNSGI